MFKNRIAAGTRLAERLGKFVFRKPGISCGKDDLVIVGMPMGGVIVALEVARQFACRLEVIVTSNIPAPGRPEITLGAVASDGSVVMNRDFKEKERLRPYLQELELRLAQQSKELEADFYGKACYDPVSFENKLVVIVDDGVMSDASLLAVVECVRKRKARAIIVAAPVISPLSYQDLIYNCDDVFDLEMPEEFKSLQQFYEESAPVSNEEVVEAMRTSLKIETQKVLQAEAMNLDLLVK